MQFISIPVLRGYSYTTTYIQVEVYNQFELQKRIKDFVDKKAGLTCFHEKGAYNVCKTLFQKKFCELFYMPTRRKEEEPLASGQLCCCSLFEDKGLVLCFIPSIDRIEIYCQKVKKLALYGSMYPIFTEPDVSSVSIKDMLFLIHEEGSIGHDVDGIYSFQGIEVALLKPKNLQPTLFCGKTYSSSCRPSRILIGSEENLCYLDEKYISVSCLSKIDGLFCQMKFPILTEQELKNKIMLLFENELEPAKIKTIPSENCLICFPFKMSLDLPFGGIQGGLLYFSYKGTEETGGFLQIFIMSNLAKSSKVKNLAKSSKVKNLAKSRKVKKLRQIHTFPFWLKKRYNFEIVNTDTICSYFFRSNTIKLVQKKGSKEFVLEGAKMELVCNLHEGHWGLCLSKKEEISLALQEKNTTCISSNPWTQNTEKTCQQTLLESPQSSDLEGEIAKKYFCLGKKVKASLWFPPLFSEEIAVSQNPKKNRIDQPSFCSSTYGPKKGTSKGIKKKASACLGLKFAEQGPFWESSCGSKKGKAQTSERPLARLTASMVRLPADAVPLQSAPLQLHDLPLFISRDLQETTQDTMTSLSAISSGFFQQNSSSTTVSQDATASHENAWKAILDIINAHHSSTTSSESTSTTTSLGISSVPQEATESNENDWEDICAIIKNKSLENPQN